MESAAVRMRSTAIVMTVAATFAPLVHAQDARPLQSDPVVAAEATEPTPVDPAAVAPGSVAAAPAAPAAVEEVLVTGSRIARNGYDTPTPVTVVTEADLESAASPNIADFVNQLPSVSGSVTPATSNRSLSSGAAGVNTVSLRGLGPTRTLVLLDGHRSVGSLADGTVDINTIPQGLVKSVEVVTGGASATYGSDAVAGVVNFILDRKYTGIKADISAGETTYGDDKTWTGSLTSGIPFADGRGHMLFNAQMTRRDGVYGMGSRGWADDGTSMTLNPAYEAGNGLPQYRVSSHAGLNTLTGGGIITGGPLRGVYFGPGGTINHYNYGDDYSSAARSAWTIGGDWQQSQHNDYTSLQPEERTDGLFGRLSYSLTDNVEVFGEASWDQNRALQWGGKQTDKANISIKGDNAFIPQALRDSWALQNPGVAFPDFTMGSWNADIPTRESDNKRQVQRYVIGANGDFDLWTAWKWDTYYQKGITDADERLYSANRQRLAWAQDAVVDPSSSGAIVCRAVLQGVAGADGCVPFNRMGIGVNDAGTIGYFMGNPARKQTFKQDVAALNFSTNIVNPWLEPIGIAFGIEHRRESISGKVDEQYQTGWIVGNFLPTNGDYTVTEGYLETLVPLPLGFEFNGAVRATNYSESGAVQTWKTGLTWSPVRDVKFRATRSRDIRAPNLSELFQAGTKNTNSLSDPWNADTPTRYTQTVTGNLDLDPEKADTLGLGLVYRPSFVQGLGVSVDYYDIKLNGAIDSLTPQEIMDRCAAGNTDLCTRITAVTDSGEVPYGSWNYQSGPEGNVSEFLILNSPYNFVQQRARGLDLEMSYQFALGRGDMMLRALGTHYLEMSQDNGVNAPIDRAGQNTGTGPADWIYRLSATYNVDRWTLQATGRGVSAGVYDNTYIECSSDCPVSTSDHRTIADNRIGGAIYLDTYLAYTIPFTRATSQIYFKVNNLFNKDPEPVGLGPSDSTNVEPGINRSLYDYLGRTFRLGLRVEWS
jgi:outer membrane receptor protein involved in Fe transport